MAKFRPYHSPLKRLWQKLGFIGSFISDTYYKYNKFDDYHDSRGTDDKPDDLVPEFLGAFHPWISMFKDVVDTLKPYKSGFHVWRDLLQPIRGLGNIIKGVVYIPTTIALFIFELIRGVIHGIARSDFNIFKNLMQLAFVRVSSGLLDGINNIIRGVLQVVTTPLNLIIRMPLRLIITAIKGWPTFEETQYENASKLEELINKDDKTLDDTLEIDFRRIRFHKKIEKAEQKGQEFINKNELDIKLNSFESFTDTRLTDQGYLNGVFGGSCYRSPYPKDGLEKRQKALEFLSLFTHKKSTTPTDSSVIIEEAPLLTSQDI